MRNIEDIRKIYYDFIPSYLVVREPHEDARGHVLVEIQLVEAYRDGVNKLIGDLTTDRADVDGPTEGGALADIGGGLRLSTGEHFHSFSFKGDLSGWRRLIIANATAMGRANASVVSNSLHVSDGRIIPLTEVDILMY
jgi:hypothetical protein